DLIVTGVQTCALPICGLVLLVSPREGMNPGGDRKGRGGEAAVKPIDRQQRGAVEEELEDVTARRRRAHLRIDPVVERDRAGHDEIGRASCRERVEVWV